MRLWSLSPIRSATRMEAWFSGWMTLMPRSFFQAVKEWARGARGPRLRAAAEVAQDLGVRVQRGVVLDVAPSERPQPQPFRLQGRDFESVFPGLHGGPR